MSQSELSSFVSLDELHALCEKLRTATYQNISDKRQELFQEFNGDIFYSINLWPKMYQRFFWAKPVSDKHTLQLFLFLCGNGCPPHAVAKWIIYSQFWDVKCVKKRFLQLKYIIENFEKNCNVWFYFDIHTKKHMFLSGLERRVSG